MSTELDNPSQANMRLLLALACILTLLFILPSLAHAATAKQTPAPAALTIDLDKGKLVHLGGTAKSVFIANPDVADIQMLSPDSLMVFGKKTGETTLVAVSESNATLLNERIVVTQDLDGLRAALKNIVPGSRIEAQSVPGGIVLSGDVATPAEAADANRIAVRYAPTGGEIINRIAVHGANQVMLKVRFAEMSRSVNKALGVNFENGAGHGDFLFGLASPVDVISDTGQFERPNANYLFDLGLRRGSLDLNGVIDALESDGLTTILAEPSLTATNGETASFLAGGEIPIPVPGQDGVTNIEYKSYGVSLAFTPTMLDGERIGLRVKPEVSQLSQANAVTIQGVSVPSLITRRAETTVNVASGQSFVIAGLLQNNTGQNVTKFPFLGDLPVLGALFRSQNFQRGESELVIIITPYIVKPIDGHLATPIDGFDVPGDGARVIGNKMEAPTATLPVAKLANDPNGQPLAYTLP